MKKIEVSAPGKLMLYGEHAVVHGQPCIVTAVDQRIQVTIEKTPGRKILIRAPEVNVQEFEYRHTHNPQDVPPRGIRFVAAVLDEFNTKNLLETGLNITTKSEFSSQFGFGSSSAVTVALVRALSENFQLNLSKKEIFDLSYKAVLHVQGVGSGFDLAAAIWGGVLYFIAGGKEIIPLNVSPLPLIVGYTGIKADTSTWVKLVADKYLANKKIIGGIFNRIGEIVYRARERLEEFDFQSAGELMNTNQSLLESLGVSTPKLTQLILTSRESGAWGAKLSGAGGGDCMIALAESKYISKIEKAIKMKGGVPLHVQTAAEGVRLE